MRILCLCLSAFDKVGGIQTFNKYFYRALSDNNINYKVISLHDCKSPNSNIYVCNSNFFKFIYFLFKFSNKETINVWQHVSLTVFLPILKVITGLRKNILIVHGTEAWGKKLSIFKKYGLKNANQIWCVSKFSLKKISLEFDVKKAKLKLFPNCIDISNNSTKKDNPFKKEKFNILTILRLDKSEKLNAIFEILDAMLILKKEKIDIHFTIIGTGNFQNKIKKIIYDKQLEENVSMLGFVKNTNQYLKFCDLFSLTSSLEGFGIVYLEAMLYKKPCLSSKNCGSEDVVIDNVTGFSIEKNDILGLAKVIKKIQKEKIIREELGKNGYKHLMKNFTFAKFRKNQLTLFKDFKNEL